MKNYFFLILFITGVHGQSYNWPCQPFNQQHNINGTFCENRISGSILIDHFHDGVDIHLPQGNNVYSVINGTVTSIGTVAQYGINSYVRVGRYAYVHVNPHPSISVGNTITAFQTVLGTTNSWNHIHLKDGYPGSEINALRNGGGLDPFVDTFPPNIHSTKFYINGTTTQFQNNKLTGPVEIVSHASDKTDLGPVGDNNGIYSIGYQIFDSSGTIPISSPIVNFRFDSKPSNGLINNVYFPGSNQSTYIYTITNHYSSDGYWNTQALNHGYYRVKVFTEDTRSNIYERWSTVELMPQDNTPPAAPVLSSIKKTSANQWTLSWLPNDSSDINGYRFYFSFDNNNWTYQQSISNQLTPQDTTVIWDNFGNDTDIYFRLGAYDDAPIPNQSDTSDAYGIRLSSTDPGILIVDGFDRTDGYWNKTTHTFAGKYGRILAELELPFNTCSNEAVISGKIQFQNYDAVIYLLGDESGQTKSLDQNEQGLIKNYLRGGGKLIISGSEIGYDLVQNGSVDDSLFYENFLKAKFVADSSAYLTISGTAGTIYSNFSADLSAPNGNIFRADVIDTANSIQVLNFGDGSIAGIYFNGTFTGGTNPGHIVYLAFPIEIINQNNKRTELLSMILYQFGIIPIIYGVEDDNTIHNPDQIKLFNNYPNPFNPTTTIEFYLPKKESVELKIFNTIGQKIKTLFSGTLEKGIHKYFWDSSQLGNLASGVFYYRLKTNDFTQTKKLILLK